MTIVKVYGERHTGTNLITKVLRGWPGVELAGDGGRHYDDVMRDLPRLLARLDGELSRKTIAVIRECLIDDLTTSEGPIDAWKHAVARFHEDFAAKAVSVVFLVKSPGAWLASLRRVPYHRLSRNKDNALSFVSSPWVCVRRELGPAVVPNLVALWNLKIDSYFSFAEEARGTPARVIFIRSEDLVLDQVKVLRRVAEWLGVAPPDGIAEIRRHVTKGRRRLDDLKSYYGEEAWRSELGEEALAFVAGEARADLLERAGYDPVSMSPVAA